MGFIAFSMKVDSASATQGITRFYETRTFITGPKKTHHWTLPQIKQKSYTHPLTPFLLDPFNFTLQSTYVTPGFSICSFFVIHITRSALISSFWSPTHSFLMRPNTMLLLVLFFSMILLFLLSLVTTLLLYMLVPSMFVFLIVSLAFDTIYSLTLKGQRICIQRFMAKNHAGYCWLVRGPNLEE
jgi:hypothetical protein